MRHGLQQSILMTAGHESPRFICWAVPCLQRPWAHSSCILSHRISGLIFQDEATRAISLHINWAQHLTKMLSSERLRRTCCSCSMKRCSGWLTLENWGLSSLPSLFAERLKRQCHVSYMTAGLKVVRPFWSLLAEVTWEMFEWHESIWTIAMYYRTILTSIQTKLIIQCRFDEPQESNEVQASQAISILTAFSAGCVFFAFCHHYSSRQKQLGLIQMQSILREVIALRARAQYQPYEVWFWNGKPEVEITEKRLTWRHHRVHFGMMMYFTFPEIIEYVWVE